MNVTTYPGASRAGWRGALAFLPLLSTACAMPARTADDVAPVAGRWVEGTASAGGTTRPWRLYLPRGHDPRRPAPLVVLLHGCTQDAADVARGARVEQHADARGAAVLMPEQPVTGHPRRCWSWYDPAHQGRDAGEPAAIAAAARAAIAAHGLDARRTTVAGISAGGAMAIIAGAAHPDLFAAVGVHSAVPLGAAVTVPEALAAMQGGARDTARIAGAVLVRAMGPHARAVPIIAFHGAADAIVHPRNAEQVVAQFAAAHALLGQPAGAATTTTLTAGGRAVTRTVHASGAIESWIVDGLGHAWSGGSPEGTFTDAAGPDATAEIVRFLLAQRMPDAKVGVVEQRELRIAQGDAEARQ